MARRGAPTPFLTPTSLPGQLGGVVEVMIMKEETATRIADALEGIRAALERAYPPPNPTLTERTVEACKPVPQKEAIKRLNITAKTLRSYCREMKIIPTKIRAWELELLKQEIPKRLGKQRPKT